MLRDFCRCVDWIHSVRVSSRRLESKRREAFRGLRVYFRASREVSCFVGSRRAKPNVSRVAAVSSRFSVSVFSPSEVSRLNSLSFFSLSRSRLFPSFPRFHLSFLPFASLFFLFTFLSKSTKSLPVEERGREREREREREKERKKEPRVCVTRTCERRNDTRIVFFLFFFFLGSFWQSFVVVVLGVQQRRQAAAASNTRRRAGVRDTIQGNRAIRLFVVASIRVPRNARINVSVTVQDVKRGKYTAK